MAASYEPIDALKQGGQVVKTKRVRLNKNKLTRRSILTAGCAGILSAVSGRKGFTQGTAAKISYLMGTTPHFGNVIVADVKGIFKQHGVNVEITNFSSGAVATQAFAAGQGDLVNAADLSALLLWNRGNIGLTPQAKFQDLTVVVGRKNMNQPSDLKGKKVGVLMASTSEYFTRVYLASGGVAFSDIDAVNLTPAQMINGFANGDIDAFVIWQPYGWRAIQAVENSRIVVTAGKYIREYQFVTMRSGYYDGHRSELISFISALDEASKWLSNNLDEGASLVAKRIGLDDVTVARRMFDHIKFDMTYTPQLRNDMEEAAKFLNIKIDWSKMFDTRALQAVNPEFVKMG